MDCTTASRGLIIKENLYAHYSSQVSWHGGLIFLKQVSFNRRKLVYDLNGFWCTEMRDHTFSICRLHRSPILLFVLLHKLFSAQFISEQKIAAVGDRGVSTEGIQVSGENCVVFQHPKCVLVNCMEIPACTNAYVTHLPNLSLVAAYLTHSSPSSGAKTRTMTFHL